MMRKVFTSRYDLAGADLIRLMKLAVIGKCIPIGNLRGGPGVRCLGILSLLHYFGYPLYYINARYGDRLQFLRRALNWLRASKR